MSSSMPHLQAAQRRTWRVVPVNCPSMRGATSRPARASSPLKMVADTCAPVRWLYDRFAPLFSADGLLRTHVVHWASDGSAAPGGWVPKRAGAAGVAGLADREEVAEAPGDGEPDAADPGPAAAV